MENLNGFLQSFHRDGVSDMHFKVGRPPLLRIHGRLVQTESAKLTARDTENLAMALLGPDRWQRFTDTWEIDTSYSIPGVTRYRVSVFRQRGSICIVMRIIPFTTPTLDELHVPAVVKEIAGAQNGLIFVTGITGSGKSSTLAGIIGHINTSSPDHIITIEDPIEFLHRDDRASVNQREIGTDTTSFANAFRSALRQDPDVIMVGELRDIETMQIALQASETGHLVLSTLHTTDAKETIGRFIDSFPPHQQNQIRIQLAVNLRAVISQRLLTKTGGEGRVLACEIMRVTPAIRDRIMEPGRTGEIVELMEKGRDQYGMQTFDQALMALVQDGSITKEEAIKNATSPNDMRVKLALG